MYSKSPWTKGLTIISILGTIVIVALIVYVCYVACTSAKMSYMWIFAAILTMVLLWAIVVAPMGVSVDKDGNITIHLLACRIRIAKEEIIKITGEDKFNKLIDEQKDYMDSYYDNFYAKENEEAVDIEEPVEAAPVALEENTEEAKEEATEEAKAEEVKEDTPVEEVKAEEAKEETKEEISEEKNDSLESDDSKKDEE